MSVIVIGSETFDTYCLNVIIIPFGYVKLSFVKVVLQPMHGFGVLCSYYKREINIF